MLLHQQYESIIAFWGKADFCIHAYSIQLCCVLSICIVCCHKEKKHPTEIPLITNTISASIPMWLNDPINAIWIAENPFTNHFRSHHSFCSGLFFPTKMLLRIKVLIDWMWFNFKICTRKKYIEQRSLNSCDTFRNSNRYFVIWCASNKTKRIQQIEFLRKFIDGSNVHTNWYWWKYVWPIYFPFIRCNSSSSLNQRLLFSRMHSVNLFFWYHLTNKNKKKQTQQIVFFLTEWNHVRYKYDILQYIKNEMEKLLSDC